jgi:8-oxo-dGTP pyrophosphatase MutT (NUDIX family)
MRLPIQLECIIFRQNKERYEFLMLKRIQSRGGFWQPITGGFETKDKSMLAGAYREIKEEAGINKKDVVRAIENIYYYELDADVPVKGNLTKVKEYAFAFEVKPDLKISIGENLYDEHDEYKWATFDEALKLLKWEGNKEALKKLKYIL